VIKHLPIYHSLRVFHLKPYSEIELLVECDPSCLDFKDFQGIVMKNHSKRTLGLCLPRMTGFNLPKKRLDKVNGPCSLVEENTE
jgi:hypothetical protein